MPNEWEISKENLMSYFDENASMRSKTRARAQTTNLYNEWKKNTELNSHFCETRLLNRTSDECQNRCLHTQVCVHNECTAILVFLYGFGISVPGSRYILPVLRFWNINLCVKHHECIVNQVKVSWKDDAIEKLHFQNWIRKIA